MVTLAGPVTEHPTVSSPRRTIAVVPRLCSGRSRARHAHRGIVGCDRAAGGEEVSERDGEPTGQVGALLRATPERHLLT